jgi:glycerophosphoryl diester phosphodiesterase
VTALGASAAVLLGSVVAAGPVPALTPSSDLSREDGLKVAEWERMWFRGGGTPAGTQLTQPWTPPTVKEMKSTAPAATSIGLFNPFWFKGDWPSLPAFPPFIPTKQPAVKGVDVPKDFGGAKIPVYIWYNTNPLIQSDSPEGKAPLLGIPLPGWDKAASTKPAPKWIATDKTTEYKKWAAKRGGGPIMVAHRGGGEVGENASTHPENSLAAFNRAVADGAKVLESDVQWTKPEAGQQIGVPVLMHDQWINRTLKCKPTAVGCTNPTWPTTDPGLLIPVVNLTKAELDQYQLSNGEDVPTLDQLLAVAETGKDVAVLPEVKNWSTPVSDLQPQLEQYTRTLLDSRLRVLIGSFDPGILQYFKDLSVELEQKAKCAKAPKKLKKGKTTVLLKRTCKTNAGTTVSVSLDAKKKVAKLVKGKNGKRSVKVMKAGKVTITYASGRSGAYLPYQQDKSYRVR